MCQKFCGIQGNTRNTRTPCETKLTFNCFLPLTHTLALTLTYTYTHTSTYTKTKTHSLKLPSLTPSSNLSITKNEDRSHLLEFVTTKKAKQHNTIQLTDTSTSTSTSTIRITTYTLHVSQHLFTQHLFTQHLFTFLLALL